MSKQINIKIMKDCFHFNLKTYLLKKNITKKKYEIIFYNAINNYYNMRLKPATSVYIIPADDLLRLYSVKVKGKVDVSEIFVNRWFFFKAARGD